MTSILANKPTGASSFFGVNVPSYDFLVNCMHCGLCLPQCPTYALTGLEKSSPRGRIRLIKAVADGDLPMTQGFIDEMNFCLDCQACETACPAGVKYGALVESARAQILQQGYEQRFSALAKKFFFRWVFSRHNRIRLLASLLKFYQKFGFQWFFQKSGLLKLVSRRLHDIQGLAPAISEKSSTEVYSEIVSSRGETKYRIGFLSGCIMDVAYADVNIDTVELLRNHRCEVIIPKAQVCCGSLQAHHGDMEVARRLAQTNIEAFSRFDLDAIVINSAGCGAFMKEYVHLLKDVPVLATKARELSSKVKDITEFLTELGYHRESYHAKADDIRGKRVTYHDACHLVHTQKISKQPRDLIRSVQGIEYVELPESTWCCGSAGIYNITHYDDSMKLLERKLQNIRTVKPDIIVTGNPGCLAQIQYGLAKEGMKVELMHTATFLRRASET